MARTLEEQTNSLAAYLPTGRAWTSKGIEGTVTRGLLAGLSGELLRNADLVEEFRQEILPDKTTLFIDEWERAVKIPDDCFTGVGTIEERRNDVLAKLTSLGVQTAEDLRRLALTVYKIQIEIRNPARDPDNVFPYTFNPTGEQDPSGDGGELAFNLSDREARFQIIIEYQNLPSAVLFPYNFPLPFLTREVATIECLFAKLRPANVGFTQEIPVPVTSPVPPPIPPLLTGVGGSVEFFSSVSPFSWNMETSSALDYGVMGSGATGFTLSAWARDNGGIVDNRAIFQLGEIGVDSHSFYLTQNPATTNQFKLIVLDTAFQKQITPSISAPGSGDWWNFTVTWNGGPNLSDFRIYINGVEDTGKTASPNQNIAAPSDSFYKMSIGALIGGAGSAAQHVIYSVAMWNKSLSSSEISAIYNSGLGDEFDLLSNQNGYTSADKLKSWYLPAVVEDIDVSPTWGTDFGPNGNTLNIVNNLTPNEITSEVPTPP